MNCYFSKLKHNLILEITEFQTGKYKQTGTQTYHSENIKIVLSLLKVMIKVLQK